MKVLLTGSFVLSNKKRNLRKYWAAFFKHIQKKKRKVIWQTLQNSKYGRTVKYNIKSKRKATEEEEGKNLVYQRPETNKLQSMQFQSKSLRFSFSFKRINLSLKQQSTIKFLLFSCIGKLYRPLVAHKAYVSGKLIHVATNVILPAK